VLPFGSAASLSPFTSEPSHSRFPVQQQQPAGLTLLSSSREFSFCSKQVLQPSLLSPPLAFPSNRNLCAQKDQQCPACLCLFLAPASSYHSITWPGRPPLAPREVQQCREAPLHAWPFWLHERSSALLLRNNERWQQQQQQEGQGAQASTIPCAARASVCEPCKCHTDSVLLAAVMVQKSGEEVVQHQG
jgi:hypothetical protein